MTFNLINSFYLSKFIEDSNEIEGIHKGYYGIKNEITIYEKFLILSNLTRKDLEEFVKNIANVSIRDRNGMDVRIGSHRPPLGGPKVAEKLEDLLTRINELLLSSFESHREYETLHPFMDCNGRSGRAIWAWQMIKENKDPFSLPFLHRWYYQSLEHSR